MRLSLIVDLIKLSLQNMGSQLSLLFLHNLLKFYSYSRICSASLEFRPVVLSLGQQFESPKGSG
jgi:hypothetical protein